MSIHQPAAGPATGRRTHHPKKVTASVLAGAMLVVALAPLAAQPANAELVSFAPVTTADSDGFPDWYSDGNVRLKLCVDAAEGCLAELPFPDQPISYPGNFPGEAFWFAAEAAGGNLGLYEAALEAAHTGEEAAPGTQIAFSRLRFRLTGLVNGADYTISHPYGVHTFRAGHNTARPNDINMTIDEGVCGTPCDFNQAKTAFLGDYGGIGSTAPFIRQTNAPAGALGSIAAPGPITGAPSGFNYVEVVGPNAGGPGVNVLRVSTFAIQGVIDSSVDGAPSTPDLAVASDSGRSNTDNITNVNTPTFTGTATPGSIVELLAGTRVLGSTTATAEGSYSITVSNATNAANVLADGANRVTARTPAAGTTSELVSGALALTVDRTAPAATLTSTPSNPSADTTPAFTFTGEASATFECQLLPSNATWRACTSPHTYDQQLTGNFTFNVRATDVAGNTGANATYGWRIGSATTTPPPPPAGTAEQKDMNGDGNPDLVARDSGGNLYLYPSTAAGGFGTRVLIGSGWGSMNAILQPGDFSGDGRSDIMARDTSGRLWLYTGTGTGRINGGALIGTGWSGMNALITPGDFNGDNRADLLARSTTGALYLYPGNGASGFGTRTQPGSGWGGFTAILSTGDFSGDNRSDVIARNSSGALFLYTGTGTGRLNAGAQIGTGWNGFTMTGTGAWGTANTSSDLVARDGTGRLYAYNGSGTGSFAGARTQIGTGWGGFTIAP
ncbi:Ig-like domain-containing protein [Arthrobacter sp. EH-1B-1]|uniref:Ig-like domain-containing protein n=1 Tax=Arthrobacter vasquezii TaxID=2977629 RepID=A0ABT6CVV5_9MICC|nr:FG-GAP-like repeat-containing protein [Arthrobacter vasquezii]MDF9278208.1 Ig-like domain-containing protein [Arthrobacter vasquezii]